MAVPNKVSAVLEDTVVTEIKTCIDDIQSRLPFLVDLSPDEIRELPKLGDKSVAFVTKALELVSLNEDFLPRSFDTGEFRKDVELFQKLYAIQLSLRMLVEKISDTYILAGSEAYAASLVVYASAKRARGDLAGLESILDDLSKRFVSKVADIEEHADA